MIAEYASELDTATQGQPEGRPKQPMEMELREGRDAAQRIQIRIFVQMAIDMSRYAVAQALLQHPATRLHEGGTNRRVTVKQADYAWGTRLNIARKKGLPPLPGCQHLVGELNKLPGETALEYVIFENEDRLGVFWFVEQSGVPIGFIVACLTEAPATSN